MSAQSQLEYGHEQTKQGGLSSHSLIMDMNKQNRGAFQVLQDFSLPSAVPKRGQEAAKINRANYTIVGPIYFCGLLTSLGPCAGVPACCRNGPSLLSAARYLDRRRVCKHGLSNPQPQARIGALHRTRLLDVGVYVPLTIENPYQEQTSLNMRRMNARKKSFLLLWSVFRALR